MSTLRFYPQNKDISYYEHMHRYLFAAEFVKNKTVLDISCGEGYGSFILSKNAKSVIGCDIDEDIVKKAIEKYKKDNLTFDVADCASIKFKDNSFDCMVSFETIEHFYEQEKFLLESKRILKEDGFLIISTPDTIEYSINRNYKNEDHVKEFTRKEFEDFLKKVYKYVYIYGQKFVSNSIIYRENENIDEYKAIYNENDKFSIKPMYMIAICSDNVIELKENTIFGDNDSDNEYMNAYYGVRELEKQLSNAKESFEKLNLEINEARNIINTKNIEISNAKTNFDEKEKELTSAKEAISEKEKELTSAKEVISEKEKELTSAKEVISEKEKELTSAKEVISEKEKELTSAKEVIIGKEKELTSAKEVISEKEKELTSAKEVIGEKEKELISARESIKSKDFEIESAKIAIDEKDKELKNVNEIINEYNINLSKLNDEKKALEFKLNKIYNNKILKILLGINKK